MLHTTQGEHAFHITRRHLQVIHALIKGSTAEECVRNTTEKFEKLTAGYSAYDYYLTKQELFKFFEDKHIKVSLFIQDEIQGLDGTVYLNFTGQGPFKSIKVGSLNIYGSQPSVRQF